MNKNINTLKIVIKAASSKTFLIVAGLTIGLSATGVGVYLDARPAAEVNPGADTYVLSANRSKGSSTGGTMNATPNPGSSVTQPSSVSMPSAANPTTVKPTTTVTGPAAPSGSISLPLFVDPTNSASAYALANSGAPGASLIFRVGQQSVAHWFGGWSGPADVSDYVGRASSAHALPVLVAYNIPNRDCGGYSAGGAQTEVDYSAWIQQFAASIANRPALVILEPDAIALQSCLNADQLAARNRELSNAVNVLASAGARVYLDAGHSGWVSASDTASRLSAAGIGRASGFALNVSNFGTTGSNTSYGDQVSALTGGKHYVIDTSRNGAGPTADGQWCNPAGRALGLAPTTSTNSALADAYLWIKAPWESDGSCSGHPAAGQADWPYVVSLAQTAGW